MTKEEEEEEENQNQNENDKIQPLYEAHFQKFTKKLVRTDIHHV